MSAPVDNLTEKISGLEQAVKTLQARCEHLDADRQALGAKCEDLQRQLNAAATSDGEINAAAGKVQALTEAITSSLPDPS